MAKYTWNGRYRPNAFTPENDRDQLLDVELLGSVRDADLADDIIAEGCEIQKETMVDLFARREKALAKRLLSGYSFVNDIVQMQPRVTGVFEDINTPFDPNVNKCVVDMTAAAALRSSLASEVGVKIIGTKEAGGAKIGAVTNTITGAKDGTVPIGDDVIIEGEKIKILDEADTEQGDAGKGTAGNAAAVNTEPNSEDDFDWEANKDLTEITIERYKGTRNDVVIPAMIQDVPVTQIGKRAFQEKKITSVVIPEGVKVIGREAFSRCRQLVSVTLPENVSIGEAAFDNCTSLKSLDIPKGCQLDKLAFSDCYNLESVTLPDDLKIIPDACFSGCKKLASINFPSALKFIGKRAFNGCPFTSVDIPEGVEFIGESAFNSDSITSVSLPKSLKWVGRGRYSDDIYYMIRGDNIADIKIAEGCAPKNAGPGSTEDLRDFIKGAAIDKSIKLQKLLASVKVPERSGEDKKALKKDLKGYGFSDNYISDEFDIR